MGTIDTLAPRDAAVNPHPAPRGEALPPAGEVAVLRERARALLPEIAAEASARESRRERPLRSPERSRTLAC
jgi:hypothetical protein